MFQKIIDFIKSSLKSLQNLKNLQIFQKVKSTLSSFFSGLFSNTKTKFKTFVIDTYNGVTGSISNKVEAVAKGITKALVNGIHISPLVDFLLNNPYKKPEKSNWETWGMEDNTAINVPVWQLWFAVIYVAASQVISLVLANTLRTLTEMYLVTLYSTNMSVFPIKYASESLQTLIIYGTQLSTAWIFLYFLLKIVKSMKR